MEVIAHTRNLRMSARKVRLVAGVVRGMPVAAALTQLRFIPKAASRPVEKLLRSAMANAEHNFQLDRDGLFVKSIAVDMGTPLKRWRARAFGRAAPITKHACHITVVLASATGALRKQGAESHEGHDHVKGHEAEEYTEVKDTTPLAKQYNQQGIERVAKKGAQGGTKQRIFNRKAG